MIARARLAAYDVLHAVASGRADLPAALARARSDLTDERDRALAGEIATGTLRWQAAFDHIIESYAGRRIDRLDREVVLDLQRRVASEDFLQIEGRNIRLRNQFDHKKQIVPAARRFNQG